MGKLTKDQIELLRGLAESPRYASIHHPPLQALLSLGLAQHTSAPWMWRRPQTAITELGRSALSNANKAREGEET